ncbi:hypothetical protein BH11ACT5_BH11ACT5_24690 [soil metagenome]
MNAPEGWGVPQNTPAAADVYLVDEEAAATSFINTLNVILDSATGETTTEIEAHSVAYLEGPVGATKVQVRPRVTIAGSETAHISAQLSRNGITYWTEQYPLAYTGIAYTVTFSFGETVSQGDREALAESVLATWTWADTPAANPGGPAGYYEDAGANFAITFPGNPIVKPGTGSFAGSTPATYSTAPDSTAPDAVYYRADGTSASEVEILPANLKEIFSQLVDQGVVLAGSQQKFELEGMPALMTDITLPDGKPGTVVVAGDGHRIYELVVVDGTADERQKFFDSFKLLS